MSGNFVSESKHFTLQSLTPGVYACIHRAGGGAYSNAGIIDLSDRTLVVDAFDTLAAGRHLRQVAEILFDRPVDTLVLTHEHSDHWIGASAFDAQTTLLSSKTIRQECLKWGAELMQEYRKPAEWKKYLEETQAKLQTEQDEKVRIGLENSIIRTRYVMAEMREFEPRYADVTFEGSVSFYGAQRNAEVRSMGRGHSQDDTVVLLPKDGIAFIGDIGFFKMQPFLGFCDLEGFRRNLLSFKEADFPVLIPGHGPVGGEQDLLDQLEYLDVMEDRIHDVVLRGGSYEDALRIQLPEPFTQWLVGGMARYEVNVRYFFERAGGEIPDEA